VRGVVSLTSMEKKPVVLWRHGTVACVVTQHSEAKSYEIQVLADGRLIERRWFVASEEATAFASAYRDKLHSAPS